MKISRVLLAASLALLAAAPLASPGLGAVEPPPPPKPPAEGEADPDRDIWRDQAIGLCVSGIGEGEGVGPAQLVSTCRCAADRFVSGRRAGTLPSLGPGLARAELRGLLFSCAFEQGPALAAAFARRLAEPPPVVAAPPIVAPEDAKPVETPAPEPGDAPKRSSFNLRAWLDGLSLPSWLTDSGLPPWAWVPLAFLAFALLRALFRGGGGRDLIGPPPSMRLGARHQPGPRESDPPQRS